MRSMVMMISLIIDSLLSIKSSTSLVCGGTSDEVSIIKPPLFSTNFITGKTPVERLV